MSHPLIYLLLIGSAFFWGGTFNLAKIAVAYLPPFTIASMRFVLAALLMGLVSAFWQKDVIGTLKRNWKAYLIMGLVGQVGFNLFFFFGMRHTSPTNGALIMATNPLVTALLAGLLLREPVSRNHKTGTLISFVGVAAIIMAQRRGGLVSANLGDGLVILANVCMALYSLAGKRYLKGSTPVLTTTWTMVAAAPVLCVLAAIFEPHARITGHPWSIYLCVGFISILGSGLAYIFWNYGLLRIGVADTAVFFHLVPVFTVFLSFLLGQTVSGLQLAAGAVVIAGVMISSGVARRLLVAVFARPQAAPPA
jgi:drug/metabolite transporter (DMT)-like permease